MKKIIMPFFAICMLLVTAAHVKAVERGWEKHSIGTQKSPIYLYVDDIDDDGKLDVAATTNVHPKGVNSEVAWYRNNGSPTDWEKTIISSDAADSDPVFGAAGIVISDIDGDGHKDVVVVTGNVLKLSGSVYWFKAPDDPAIGPWQRFTLETGVADSYFKVYTMDANGDGNQDIIVGGNRGAFMFLNPGTPGQAGTVWIKLALPPETGSSLYLDDVNDDGKTDIVNSHTGSPDYIANVSWINVTSAAGEFTPTFNLTAIDADLPEAFDVNTLDVNEDGKEDVAVSIFQLSHIYWYEQPATSGQPWIQHLISDTYDGTDMYTGDIDSNGKSDLIISGLFGNKISWFSSKWINNDAIWTENLVDDNCTLPGDISLNDVDGDGDLDVVVAGMGTNQILWYENKLNEQEGCFLSSVLGNDSPRLESFRNFRDTAMVTIPGGNRLVAAYYEYSPALIQGIQLIKGILSCSRFFN